MLKVFAAAAIAAFGGHVHAQGTTSIQITTFGDPDCNNQNGGPGTVTEECRLFSMDTVQSFRFNNFFGVNCQAANVVFGEGDNCGLPTPPFVITPNIFECFQKTTDAPLDHIRIFCS